MIEDAAHDVRIKFALYFTLFINLYFLLALTKYENKNKIIHVWLCADGSGGGGGVVMEIGSTLRGSMTVEFLISYRMNAESCTLDTCV